MASMPVLVSGRKAEVSPASFVPTNSATEAAPLSDRIWSTNSERPEMTCVLGPSLRMDLGRMPSRISFPRPAATEGLGVLEVMEEGAESDVAATDCGGPPKR